MDHCATCFAPLKPAPLGGTYRCCKGGYLTQRAPLDRDAWYPYVRVIAVHGFVRAVRLPFNMTKRVRCVLPTGKYHVYEAPTIRVGGRR